MEIKLRNRLSYRQAKTAVLAGLAIGIILSAIQIGYDYAQELREIDTEVSDVINMFRESATQASYTVDETLAETVVKGLFEFQPIFDAKVIDEFGEVLGHKKRPVKRGKLEWLVGMIFGREKSYKVDLLSTEGQKHLGQIELLVDNYLVARDFIRRAGFVIMGGLLRNICLAFIFLLIFYYTLTKPLLATVKGVFSVDPSRPSRKLLDFPKGHNKDEIGLLVKMINRLLEGFDKSLAGRQAAEEELKKHHDRLEELVKERTAELVKANDLLHQEINERMQAEEALRESEEKYRQQSKVLEGINRVFREALTCESEKEVADTCLSVAEEISDSKFGLIGEKNPKGRFDTIAISNPGWDACKMPDSEATRLIQDMEIRGIDRATIREEKSRIVNDPTSHPDRIGTPDGHPPITSFLGVPLKHSDKTIGMISLGNKESGYDLSDQQAIEDLSIAFVEALMRKRAEEALQESEEKYRSMMEAMKDPVYICSQDYRVEYMNPAMIRRTGRDATGEHCFKALHDLEEKCP